MCFDGLISSVTDSFGTIWYGEYHESAYDDNIVDDAVMINIDNSNQLRVSAEVCYENSQLAKTLTRLRV